jgi:hypothetical protein
MAGDEALRQVRGTRIASTARESPILTCFFLYLLLISLYGVCLRRYGNLPELGHMVRRGGRRADPIWRADDDGTRNTPM